MCTDLLDVQRCYAAAPQLAAALLEAALNLRLHIQMLDNHSGHSFRLLALAMGVIPCVANLDLQHMSQAHIETSARPLRLLGVIVLSNPIKADSQEIIGELQEQ